MNILNNGPNKGGSNKQPSQVTKRPAKPTPTKPVRDGDKKIGFWYSLTEPWLAMPVTHQGGWPYHISKRDFLRKLRIKEAQATPIHYRGYSRCRICKQVNGTRSHVLDGWEWPDGYIHYIEEHNVIPDRDFAAWVVS